MNSLSGPFLIRWGEKSAALVVHLIENRVFVLTDELIEVRQCLLRHVGLVEVNPLTSAIAGFRGRILPLLAAD